MIDRATARALAQRHVDEMATPATPLALLDEHTREEDFGWVFFHGSPAGPLAGNGPFVVDRESGEITDFWSGHSVDEAILLHREERGRAAAIASSSVLSALARIGELAIARVREGVVQWRFASDDRARDEAIARAVASTKLGSAWVARRDADPIAGVWSLAPVRYFTSGKLDAASDEDREAIARALSDTLRE